MAKKDNIKRLNPSECIMALGEYQGRVSGLLNILPATIDFLKEIKTSNPGLRDKLVGYLEEHMKGINEFRNSEE